VWICTFSTPSDGLCGQEHEVRLAGLGVLGRDVLVRRIEALIRLVPQHRPHVIGRHITHRLGKKILSLHGLAHVL